MTDKTSGSNNPYSPDHDPAFAANVAGVGPHKTWEQASWEATTMVGILSKRLYALEAVQARALTLIQWVGDNDGAHHKQWALDQVVRILTETPEDYDRWVHKMKAGVDGPETYGWGTGVAP